MRERENQAEPLNEAWWIGNDIKDFPPDDAPLLAPYEETRPGFELGVAATSPGEAAFFKDVGDGYFQICLWNIWQKESDPADYDEEKRKINGMQRALGKLSDDDRYIRLQIACLARCFWTFPANVDLVLDGIVSGSVNLDSGVSCEPPWTGWREVLLHRRSPSAEKEKPVVAWLHHQQGCDPREDSRQKLLRAYMTILIWWSAKGHLDCLKAMLSEHADLAETIYRRLGKPTKLKWLYVQKLCRHLSFWAIPRLPMEKERKGNGFVEVYDNAIRQELRGEEDKISRLIARNDENGSCHHAFIRHIDHQIAHIGAGKPVVLPGVGEERRRIHGEVTNYVHVLGSWLAGRTVEQAVRIWPPCENTAQRIYGKLGNATLRKRWLVACLGKKLREDRTHGGRGALDEQPELFVIPLDVLRPL